MARPELGNVQQVRLREIWPHEGRDFTPWLAANISLLGDALGMELEAVTTEASTGNFSLDILARDRSGAYVAIENQLEPSDNSHLGKTLTYAGHFNARTLIWVSRKFDYVHRAAIDWLNRHTAPEIKIYGVEVSAIKIGESLPAVIFRPVVFPAS